MRLRNTLSAGIAAALAACSGFDESGSDVGDNSQAVTDEAAIELEMDMARLLEEHPDATRLDERSITWDDGAVLSLLPEPAAGLDANRGDIGTAAQALAVQDCPDGFYCVYEDRDFGARGPLQFSDCTRNDLDNFGFRDKTSSWVNNGPLTVQVMDDRTAQPDDVLWTMPPFSSSSFVGGADNDKADYFRCQ